MDRFRDITNKSTVANSGYGYTHKMKNQNSAEANRNANDRFEAFISTTTNNNNNSSKTPKKFNVTGNANSTPKYGINNNISSPVTSNSKNCPSSSSKTPKMNNNNNNNNEGDRRNAQREKQIRYGYHTDGYRNMIKLIRKDPLLEKGNILPLAPPDIGKKSKRMWDIELRKWRRALHMFDYVYFTDSDEDDDDDEERNNNAKNNNDKKEEGGKLDGGDDNSKSNNNDSGDNFIVSERSGNDHKDRDDEGEEKSGSADQHPRLTREEVLHEQRRQWVSVAFQHLIDGDDARGSGADVRVKLSKEALMRARESPHVPKRIPVEEDLKCVILKDIAFFEDVRNVIPQNASSLTKGTDISPFEAGIKIHLAPSAQFLEQQKRQQEEILIMNTAIKSQQQQLASPVQREGSSVLPLTSPTPTKPNTSVLSPSHKLSFAECEASQPRSATKEAAGSSLLLGRTPKASTLNKDAKEFNPQSVVRNNNNSSSSYAIPEASPAAYFDPASLLYFPPPPPPIFPLPSGLQPLHHHHHQGPPPHPCGVASPATATAGSAAAAAAATAASAPAANAGGLPSGCVGGGLAGNMQRLYAEEYYNHFFSSLLLMEGMRMMPPPPPLPLSVPAPAPTLAHHPVPHMPACRAGLSLPTGAFYTATQQQQQQYAAAFDPMSVLESEARRAQTKKRISEESEAHEYNRALFTGREDEEEGN